MDGLFHGSKPYEQMDDLGGPKNPPIFGLTPISWKQVPAAILKIAVFFLAADGCLSPELPGAVFPCRL